MNRKLWVLPLLILLITFSLPKEILANERSGTELLGPFAPGIIYLAIHHTEVRASANSRQFESVNNFHRSRFNDVSFLRKWGGYNIFIDVDGTVTWFRIYGEKTAAQLAHNFDTLSICLAGNFNVDMPKSPQIDALVGLLYEYPQLIIVFHRDLADRTCPGTNLGKPWLKKILDKYGPKEASPLKIHLGIPNLKAEDYVLIAREHQQDRDKYVKLKNDSSAIGIFQKEKLRKIIERLDRRPSKYRVRESRSRSKSKTRTVRARK